MTACATIKTRFPTQHLLQPMDLLLVNKHVSYIQSLDKKRDELAYYLTEHLRMNGLYWGLTALCILGKPDALPKQEVIDWVMGCWDPSIGAFAPHPGHDPHIHPTLSAIQILVIHQAEDLLDKDRIVAYITSLQDKSTGAIAGDEWGEYDTRFSYCAVAALSLLGRLDAIDKDLTASWIAKCQNFDGSFGMTQGAESHSANVWTSIGTLAILDRLDIIEKEHEALCWWLKERQLPNGGLNGRPEKLEDVCYSWWVLAPLTILGKKDSLDLDKLSKFILSCQDTEKGGIADRPDHEPDVWHTVFGIAGLSLLGYPNLEQVDPIYCMPSTVTDRIKKKNSAMQGNQGN